MIAVRARLLRVQGFAASAPAGRPKAHIPAMAEGQGGDANQR